MKERCGEGAGRELKRIEERRREEKRGRGAAPEGDGTQACISSGAERLNSSSGTSLGVAGADFRWVVPFSPLGACWQPTACASRSLSGVILRCKRKRWRQHLGLRAWRARTSSLTRARRAHARTSVSERWRAGEQARTTLCASDGVGTRAFGAR
eukprot:920208-Pleurochrysis_carterae.AAC.1